MFSSTTRLISIFGAALAAAAAMSTAHAADSQTDPTAQVNEDIRREQSRNGPTSENLITLYTTLGLLYREQGDKPPAAAAFESARQVVRANYGLHSLEEMPLLRQSMFVQRELGDAKTAWETEKQMLDLAARHPDDPRTAPILTETAGRRLQLLADYRAGRPQPELVLGCYYGSNYSCVAGSRRVLITSIASEARRYYTDAIGVMLRNENSNDQLRKFADEILRASYPEIYVDLRPVFGAILEYEAQHAVPARTRADTLMMLADWNVRMMHVYEDFEGSGIVLDQYELSYRLLAADHIERAKLDELFAPKLPTSLPTFAPNPLVTSPSAGDAAYIDVSFDVSSLGRGENVAVEHASGATRTDEKELEKLIESMIFRPRLARDGVPAATDHVAVRYYLQR